MNRRGKRLTLGVVAVGFAVVIVLAILNWSTVRDHVEAWRFQLTRETRRIEELYDSDAWKFQVTRNFPEGEVHGCSAGGFLLLVGKGLREPVLVAAEDLAMRSVEWPGEATKRFPTGAFPSGAFGAFPEIAREILEANEWRVLEQRFPRRAYVVIRDEHAALPELVGNPFKSLGPAPSWQAPQEASLAETPEGRKP